MNRRSFLSTTLGLTALLAALSGCGGGSDDNNDNANPAGRGAAEGYAFRSEGDGGVVFYNTAAEGAAAGLRPAAGLRAEVVGGPSATVGADGRLRLTGIEPGLRTLRLSPGGNLPPRDVPLTVPPGAVLPLGQTPVTRARAADLARTALTAGFGDGEDGFAGADVLLSSTPLPAGVAVRPAFSLSPQPMTLERPAWFVYVDFFPTARFGHETALLLVDAETGAVRTQSAGAWPTLNGASFYRFADENATSPDVVQAATRVQAVPPPAFGSASAPGASGRAVCRAADPDTARTHYLIVQGDSRDDFAADPPLVMRLLESAPFPQTGSSRVLRTFDSAVSPREQVLNAFAGVRDVAKSGDTLVLYVTSHGVVDIEAADLAASYRIVCDYVGPQGALGYASEQISPADFDFSSCKACRIVVIIDTCYSGNWIPLLRPRLEALPNKDILILTSANQSRWAEGLTAPEAADIGLEQISVPKGGLFTQTLLEGVRRNQASTPAENGADALDAAFPFADLVTTLVGTNLQAARPARWRGGAEFTQQPQSFRRPLGPDEVCGEGSETINVR